MKTILTIIGARPQIIKASAISRGIKTNFKEELREIIVHTGQHYDENMSQVFFDELEIPKENYNLQVGSGSHGLQTARMIEGIENILLTEKPDAVLTYGDTNSTLAAAVAASKIHIPVIHVEAGLRSYNKQMPEEINRIVCDHVSTLLFSPTLAGITNLKKEGFKEDVAKPYSKDNPKIYHCGDIMYDNSIFFAQKSEDKAYLLDKHELKRGEYILCTIHRDTNTDDVDKLSDIFRSLIQIVESKYDHKIILPLHPRTSKLLSKNLHKEVYEKLIANDKIIITDPVSFLEMTFLEKNAQMIITDSGGVQKEAYFFNKPCIILRPQTEWVELVEAGCAILTDTNYDAIINAFDHFITNDQLEFPPVFGDGKASLFICNEVENLLNNRK